MSDKFSTWWHYLEIIGVLIIWQLLKKIFNVFIFGREKSENDSNLTQPIAEALATITDDLAKNEPFINSINNLFGKFGLSPKLIEELMILPEMERSLKPFKYRKDIDFDVLKLELIKAYTKGMEEEAEKRGITKDMSIEEQNRRWVS
jgi:hypothetical protein